MVRVRLGSSWKQDPALRAAIARGDAAAREAVSEVVDALALEVDGIDVGAGRAEGAVVAGVEALGAAVLRLLGGAARAEVHFSEGGLELVLARRGVSVLLTVVALERPARVLARDVEVELAELARAAGEAAQALGGELAVLRLPRQGGEVAAVARGLGELAARLASARASPARELPAPGQTAAERPRQRRGSPACGFELQDEEGLLATYRGPGADLGSLLAPGGVTLRAGDGRVLLALGGAPFLLLRDLAAFAGRLADAALRRERSAELELAAPARGGSMRLLVDLAGGSAAREGGPDIPCPPLLLARALLEAAIDFCGVVAARNAWQADNGWLSELRTSSAERLAQVQELLAGDLVAAVARPVGRRGGRAMPGAPLGPGRMRRLAFREAVAADVGAPAGIGLALAGELVVAAGAAAVVGLDASSAAERWRRHEGATVAALVADALALVDAERVALVDAATGRERWSRLRTELPEAPPREVVRLAGGLTLWVAAGEAAALEPATGRRAWSFAPPAARELRAAAVGALAVVGSDAGFLYGLDAATGRPAWRLRLPGPLVATPLQLGRELFTLCTTDRGGSLIALDPASGRRRLEVPLDVTPTGPLVHFAGLLGVAGTVAGDPVVMALDPVGGLAWEAAPPLGAGALALAPVPGGLLVKTVHGTCAMLDRNGEARWTRPREALHPPLVNVPPVVARGVALVAGEEVEALEVATGCVLGVPRLVAPVRLVADAALHVWALDAEGVLAAARLATHLSVL
ncbi:MAG TPA: PQQ-binding-like beta-propeller repeat protein [Anaeromyxobacteraceae bacterium]|nr:PQQ-binding-like beta-propeller repeat protein [Anaeromyxobacteraceae bacterium]